MAAVMALVVVLVVVWCVAAVAVGLVMCRAISFASATAPALPELPVPRGSGEQIAVSAGEPDGSGQLVQS